MSNGTVLHTGNSHYDQVSLENGQYFFVVYPRTLTDFDKTDLMDYIELLKRKLNRVPAPAIAANPMPPLLPDDDKAGVIE